MRLFYCPKCKKEEIGDYNLHEEDKTVVNIRDGYGRPIIHYKCECGNYLAGSVDLRGLEDDTRAVDYYKAVIKDYNENGKYVTNTWHEMTIKAMDAYKRRRGAKRV